MEATKRQFDLALCQSRVIVLVNVRKLRGLRLRDHLGVDICLHKRYIRPFSISVGVGRAVERQGALVQAHHLSGIPEYTPEYTSYCAAQATKLFGVMGSVTFARWLTIVPATHSLVSTTTRATCRSGWKRKIALAVLPQILL